MATKRIASRLRGSRRFLSGFVAGAVVGAAGAGLAALQFFRSQGAEGALTGKQPDGSVEKAVLEQFGFPLTGTETRCYTNHALSYDQAKRVPRWVLEHISKSKIMAGRGGAPLWSQLLGGLRWEDLLSPGGGDCSEPRVQHHTPA
uniref:Exo/endonuclease G n=1 Tax=Cercocebus atys TaxID=9531 RepID=A0A2K5KX03_CERAT